jgi:hypothetical protein
MSGLTCVALKIMKGFAQFYTTPRSNPREDRQSRGCCDGGANLGWNNTDCGADVPDWLKTLFFAGKPPPERPKVIDESAYIKARFKDWQLAWHDLFDQDAALLAAGEFARPDPFPDEIDRDYQLIFGLSRATPATREKCFALFPEGAEMCRRFEEFRSAKPEPLPEKAARQALPGIIGLLVQLGASDVPDPTTARVVNRDTPEGLDLIRGTDHVTILVDDSVLDPAGADRLLRIAAGLFLTEPLYAAAGNYYHLRDYVTSVLTGGQADVLQAALYRLWLGGWQVMLDGEGLILAQRKV